MRLRVSDISKECVLPWSGATTPSVRLPVTRVANIDRLRILAAVGIVWFHTEGAPYRQIGYAGLPVFLLVFFSLITMRGRADGMAHFLKRRWHRLLKPWLFWSAIYGLGEIVQALCSMNVDSLRGMLSPGSLLIGTHSHLWYLPYAFILGFVIYKLDGWTRRLNNVAVVFASTTIGVLVLAAHATGVFAFAHRAGEPLPQWLFGLAAIPLGFAIGRCLVIPSRETRGVLLSAICLVTLMTCTLLISCGATSATVPYTIAVALVCLAYAWPHNRSDVFVTYVAPLTFGVYLVHPLIAYATKRVLAADQNYAGYILLIACLSGLAVLILKRTPVRRFV
jgi:surface polysaccharide O-acyltransferase-like enzyme